LIGLLVSDDAVTLMQLVSFTIYWIAMGTLMITFLPKINAIWQTATGFIPDRITDSKLNHSQNSGSQAATSAGGVMRSLKDFAQTTVRLMDRSALRTYITLLKKELSIAEVALSNLNANEITLRDGLFKQGQQEQRNSGAGADIDSGFTSPQPYTHRDAGGGWGVGATAKYSGGGSSKVAPSPTVNSSFPTTGHTRGASPSPTNTRFNGSFRAPSVGTSPLGPQAATGNAVARRPSYTGAPVTGSNSLTTPYAAKPAAASSHHQLTTRPASNSPSASPLTSPAMFTRITATKPVQSKTDSTELKERDERLATQATESLDHSPLMAPTAALTIQDDSVSLSLLSPGALTSPPQRSSSSEDSKETKDDASLLPGQTPAAV